MTVTVLPSALQVGALPIDMSSSSAILSPLPQKYRGRNISAWNSPMLTVLRLLPAMNGQMNVGLVLGLSANRTTPPCFGAGAAEADLLAVTNVLGVDVFFDEPHAARLPAAAMTPTPARILWDLPMATGLPFDKMRPRVSWTRDDDFVASSGGAFTVRGSRQPRCKD